MIPHEVLFEEANRLIVNRPPFIDVSLTSGLLASPFPILSEECKVWIEEARAVVDSSLNAGLLVDWGMALDQHRHPVPLGDALTRLMYRARALARLRLPIQAAGGVIDPTKPYSTFVTISEVVAKAEADLFIADPYMDASVLSSYVEPVSSKVSVRLLTTTRKQNASLFEAAQRWRAEHGANRPLEVRVVAQARMHDRLLLLDKTAVYMASQSLRDMGKSAPGLILPLPSPLSVEKLTIYSAMWDEGAPP